MALLLPWMLGCSSVRLTYGQGPMLAYWWLDGYVDFSTEQATKVRSALDDWFGWHRATQLSDYAGLLAAAQRQAVDNVTPAQVCRYSRGAETRLVRAFEQAVPAMAQTVRTLSAAQLDHLEQRYAKADGEWQRDHLQGTPGERQAAAVKRWIDRAESFYGTLEAAQRQLVTQGLQQSPYDARQWFEERRQRQAETLRILRQLRADQADLASTEAALRAIGVQMVHSPRADYRALRERNEAAQCALVAQLHNSTNAMQRQSAIARIKGWEDDLRALAGAAGTSLKAASSTAP